MTGARSDGPAVVAAAVTEAGDGGVSGVIGVMLGATSVRPSSTARIALADGKRSAGRFAMALDTTDPRSGGTDGATARTSGTGDCW